ncbi:ATP-binding protein [Nocardia sp. NPDC004151]|uniref:ATP-binding protein n=1 Tax=Nocardia sp. NPDC004151 TaxID=3364304 RepID=UPI003678C039
MSQFQPGAEGSSRQANIAGNNYGPIYLQQAPSPPQSVITDTLPRDVPTLVDRKEVLLQILSAVELGRSPAVYTVDGMPGVGKTALVTHAAHQIAHRFPDGRFFVELSTHTPGQKPASPIAVLASLLNNLGLDPSRIPDSFEDRRDMWRDRSVGKRLLLVMDDAKDVAQVEPLLPTGRECLTLITSRRRLIALDGAIPISLAPLESDAAARLFCKLARRPAAASELAAAHEIAWRCGYLPLAIVLLAGRLAHHPAWTIGAIASEFATTQNRLGELDTGERAVYVAFKMSYQNLSPDRQRLFRRLSLNPGLDIDAYAAAALDDLPVDVARQELEALYTDHLIEETTPGRYRLHDLLLEYAGALTSAEPVDDTQQAVQRLLDYYQRTAAAAEEHLARRIGPTAKSIAPPLEVLRDAGRDFANSAQAVTWMRTERANLLACLEHVAAREPMRVIALTRSLARLLDRDGPWPLAVDLHSRAVFTARDIADQPGEAEALANLGIVHRRTGDYVKATDLMQQALTIYRELGDRNGEAKLLDNLGIVHRRIGGRARAAELYQQALAIYRELGDRRGEAGALTYLGILRWSSGDHAQAADLHQQALVIFRELGDRRGVAGAIASLGAARWTSGDCPEVADLHLQALTIFRELGDRRGEAHALTNLGFVRCWHAGDYAGATDLHQQALEIDRELGDRRGEAIVLTNLGGVYTRTGDYAGAINLHQQALAIYHELGDRSGEAIVLTNLGTAHTKTGAYAIAAKHYGLALAVHRELAERNGEETVLNEIRQALLDAGDLRNTLFTHLQQNQVEVTIRHGSDLPPAHLGAPYLAILEPYPPPQ